MQHKIHSTVMQCKKDQSQLIFLKEGFVLTPSLQEYSNKHLAMKVENTFQKLISMNLSFQKELSPNPLTSQWNLEWVHMGRLVHWVSTWLPASFCYCVALHKSSNQIPQASWNQTVTLCKLHGQKWLQSTRIPQSWSQPEVWWNISFQWNWRGVIFYSRPRWWNVLWQIAHQPFLYVLYRQVQQVWYQQCKLLSCNSKTKTHISRASFPDSLLLVLHVARIVYNVIGSAHSLQSTLSGFFLCSWSQSNLVKASITSRTWLCALQMLITMLWESVSLRMM